MSDIYHMQMRWKLSNTKPTIIRLPVLESWSPGLLDNQTPTGIQGVSEHPEPTVGVKHASGDDGHVVGGILDLTSPTGNEHLDSPTNRLENNESASSITRVVGGRRKWKMRGVELYIAWFDGVGNVSIQEPLSLPSNSGLELYDLFIHKNIATGGIQVWRWESENGVELWKSLTVGKEVQVPGLQRSRILVLTEQGKPSYVTGGTIDRRYGHLDDSDDDGMGRTRGGRDRLKSEPKGK